MIDLSIIIVTWNVWPLLRACLHSLTAVTQPLTAEAQVRCFGPGSSRRSVEVIVVDNAGHDETAVQLPLEFPWVRFVRSEANLGFTGGNNLGYQASRGEIIFFLNPDTALLAPSSPAFAQG
ncbi:MAG: glycosyltransferase [Caldilineaceae bacterium]